MWDFLSRFHLLLRLDAPPTLGDVACMLVLPPPEAHVPAVLRSARGRGAAAQAAAQLTAALTELTRWVVDELYFTLVAHMTEAPNLKK